MRGSSIAKRLGYVSLVVLVCALAVARPHLTQRWALYLGDPKTPATAHLFLDPFPNLGSCDATVKVFAANAERAYCSSRLELELGTGADAILAADFDSLVPKAWFCLPKNPFIHKKA